MQAEANTINPPIRPFMLCGEGRKKTPEGATERLFLFAVSDNYPTIIHFSTIGLKTVFVQQDSVWKEIHRKNGQGGQNHERLRTSQQVD